MNDDELTIDDNVPAGAEAILYLPGRTFVYTTTHGYVPCPFTSPMAPVGSPDWN